MISDFSINNVELLREGWIDTKGNVSSLKRLRLLWRTHRLLLDTDD